MTIKPKSAALVKVIPLLIMLALLTACSQNRESAGQPGPKMKGDAMLAEKQIDRVKVSIPPIDAAAPAEFESATFGLG